MDKMIVHWEHVFFPDMVTFECIQVRPGFDKKVQMVKNNFFIFLNGKPARATQRFDSVFYDLYRDFKIPPRTIPLAILNIKAEDDAYFLILHGDGLRKFYFKPEYEKRIYELLRSFLWKLFNKLLMEKEFQDQLSRD